MFAFRSPLRNATCQLVSKMFCVGRIKFKVLNPVVLLVAIPVMDDLVREKKASQVFRHHETVLQDVDRPGMLPTLSGHRVPGAVDQPVTMLIQVGLKNCLSSWSPWMALDPMALAQPRYMLGTYPEHFRNLVMAKAILDHLLEMRNVNGNGLARH